MKNLLTTLLLLLSLSAYSQDDYMTDIAKKSCECFTDIPEESDKSKITMEFGLCMISAAELYSEELKNDHGIDFANIEREGEKLGRLIAMKMLSVCPESLIKLSELSEGDATEEVAEELYITGKIKKVNKEFFVSFSVKESGGKTSKYYWTTFIETEIDLVSDYEKLNGKQIEIWYIEQEFFDPLIGEYRKFNVITSLKKSK